MHAAAPRGCPEWCVTGHADEDEGGRARHRGATATVPGIAIQGRAPHRAHAVELLVELHAEAGDPMVAVYIGDGVDGLDLTVETASRLVRRLIETLRAAGATPV
ncbi:hypothetical protein BH09ACT4_BH09ACT4_25550 [soil metagenome]